MGTAKVEYIGRRYGRLTIIKEIGRSQNGNRRFEFKCDCGFESYGQIANVYGMAKANCVNCRRLNSVGSKIGDFVVVSQIESGRDGRFRFLLRCERCGYERRTALSNLDSTMGTCFKCSNSKGNRAHRKSVARINIQGQKFGRLTAIRHIKMRRGQNIWEFMCDCGNLHMACCYSAKQGKVRSCGCYKSEVTSAAMKTHGMSKERVYSIWCDMHKRCSNVDCIGYKNYGGRGIRVCEKWNTFEAFLKDMGEPPTKKHEIDRIDVNGPYAPDNCRWVTRKINANNRRQSRRVVVFGVPFMSFKLAAEHFGIPYSIAYRRVFVTGRHPDSVFTELLGMHSILRLN